MSVALLLGASANDASRLNRADALGSDPVGAFARSADDLDAAFRDEGVLDREVHHPRGDIPATQLLGFRITDYTLHGWDLARALGVNEALSVPLVGVVWEMLSPIAPFIAGTGVFGEGPSDTVRDDATLQRKLLDVSGRRP